MTQNTLIFKHAIYEIKVNILSCVSFQEKCILFQGFLDILMDLTGRLAKRDSLKLIRNWKYFFFVSGRKLGL